MSSTRMPHTTPVVSGAFGLMDASAKKSSNVVPASRGLFNAVSSKPVNHSIASSSSAFVRPFFSTFWM